MNKLASLLLSAGLLATGCGTEKKDAPTPALTSSKNTIQYKVNGQTLTQTARVSYQLAASSPSSFNALLIEAGDSTKGAANGYVQVVFLKGTGRPDSEYSLLGVRYMDSANSLAWDSALVNGTLQGTLAQWNGSWSGSFAGTITDRFGNPKAVIAGAFSNAL